MRLARVCSHTLFVPDSVADWDAVAEDSPWEKERMDSILVSLDYGDVLYDIGAEHGWMSAIYGKNVGGHNMVLVEPSTDFWPNIRMGWEWNNLSTPLATVQAFAGATRSSDQVYVKSWPPQSVGPECGAMAYRHPNHHSDTVPTTTIDHINHATGRPPKGITIDVEGAELTVLKGAMLTLAHDRPLLWISVHPDLMIRDFGTHPDQLFGYLLSMDYTFERLRVDHEEHWLATPKERG